MSVPQPDVQALVEKIDHLSTAEKLRLALMLLEVGQVDLAEQVTQKASVDFIIHKLHGTEAKR